MVKNLLTPRLEIWLEEIHSLSTDSLEWDCLPTFIEELETLRKFKLQQRQIKYEPLKKLLIKLKSDYQGLISYFSFTDCNSWKAENCPESQLEGCIKETEEFIQLLDSYNSYSTMLKTPTTTSNAALAKIRQVESGKKLSLLYKTLSPTLEVKNNTSPVDFGNIFSQESGKNSDFFDLSEINKLIETFDDEETNTVPLLKDTSRLVRPSGFFKALDIDLLIDSINNESSQSLNLVVANTKNNLSLPNTYSSLTKNNDIPLSPSPDKLDKRVTKNLSVTRKLKPIGVVPRGIIPPQDAALEVKEKDNDEAWYNLFWSLIGVGDTPAAYWLNRSLESKGYLCPVPSWLIKSVEAARLLSAETSSFAEELNELSNAYKPATNFSQKLLALASSLPATMIAPNSGMDKWLCSTEKLPKLDELTKKVIEFNKLKIPFKASSVKNEHSSERLAKISQLAKLVDQWLEEALTSTFSKKLEFWKALVNKESKLFSLLDPVAKNQKSNLQEIKTVIKHWETEDDVLKYVLSSLSGSGSKGFPASDNITKQLVTTIFSVCNVVKHWCNLLDHHIQMEAKDKSVSEHIEKVTAELIGLIPEATVELVNFSGREHSLAIISSSYCLRRTLGQLQDIIDPPKVTLKAKAEEIARQNEVSLDKALGQRLVWMPQIKLDEKGEPDSKTLPLVAVALRDTLLERIRPNQRKKK